MGSLKHSSKGDKLMQNNEKSVSITYKAYLLDGTLVDETHAEKPLEFTFGSQSIFPKLEKAIEGMLPGEVKMVELKSEDTFGPHLSDRVSKLRKEDVPQDVELEEGMTVELKLEQVNQVIYAIVTEVAKDGSVTLDANHPFAGKTLQYEVHRLLDK